MEDNKPGFRVVYATLFLLMNSKKEDRTQASAELQQDGPFAFSSRQSNRLPCGGCPQRFAVALDLPEFPARRSQIAKHHPRRTLVFGVLDHHPDLHPVRGFTISHADIQDPKISRSPAHVQLFSRLQPIRRNPRQQPKAFFMLRNEKSPHPLNPCGIHSQVVPVLK